MKKRLSHIASSLVTRTVTFAGNFVPLAPLTESSRLSQIYTSGSLTQYVQNLFYFSMSLGAIIAVMRLMWAGYKYMGSELIGDKAGAKKIIQDTFFGLLLLLGAWIMLNQINSQILNLDVLKTIHSAPVKTAQ